MTPRSRRVVWSALALVVVLGAFWFAQRPSEHPSRELDSPRVAKAAESDASASAVSESPAVDLARVATQPDAPEVAPAVPGVEMAELRIRAVTESHAAVPATIVCVETTRASTCAVLVCDEHGVALLQGLDLGRVAVRGLTRGETWLTLHAGLNEVELVLPSAEDLAVVVVDPTGAAVADADVHVTDPRDLNASWHVGRTDALGKFTIAALAADRSVFVTKTGFEQSASYPQWPVLLEPPRTLRVELAPGGCRFSGVVRVSETRAVVADARVRVFGLRQRQLPAAAGRPPALLGPATVRHARTDAAGHFALDDAPAPPLRVEVLAAGFAAFEGRVDAPPGALEAHLDVLLDPGATFDGVVFDAEHVPAPKALVSLARRSSDSARAPLTTVTNDAGVFRFRDIAAGAYRWNVSATRGRKVAGEIDVAGTRSIRVELPPSPAASGRVVDDAGNALARWLVGWSAEPLVADHGGYPQLPTVCDAEGRFWLRAECEPGGWVYAWPPGDGVMPLLAVQRRGTDPVELRADASVRALGSITLRSSETDRELVLSARIVRTATGLSALRGVDPRLGASFQGLPSGAYVLSVQLGTTGWKDAGRIELGAGEARTLDAPTSDVIRALPAAQ